MGKVYVALFSIATGTVLLYLALGCWILGNVMWSLVQDRTTLGPVPIALPVPIAWAAAALPLILVVYALLLLLFSKHRWPRGLVPVRWEVIPNHNIVVAMTAFNDQESISDAVREFKAQPNVKDVIVVDNNSTDRTRELATDAGATVIQEPKQGYGYACIAGLREALQVPKVNVVVLVEGDMTFNGNDLAKLVPYLDNVDMVVGTRTTQELNATNSQLNWFYVWGNMFLAKLIQLKFFDVQNWGRVRLTDVGCTMRAIRPEALHRIINDLRIGGNHFSPHMLMTAIAKGLKVLEVPVTFRKRWGVSKGAGAGTWKGFKIGLRMLWHILTF